MLVKKVYLLIVAVIIITAGTTIAWLCLWNSVPKKSPVRARQVYFQQMDVNIT